MFVRIVDWGSGRGNQQRTLISAAMGYGDTKVEGTAKSKGINGKTRRAPLITLFARRALLIVSSPQMHTGTEDLMAKSQNLSLLGFLPKNSVSLCLCGELTVSDATDLATSYFFFIDRYR